MRVRSRLVAVAVGAAVSMVCSLGALAQPDDGGDVRILLNSGDVLIGRVIEETGGMMRIEHPTFGELTVPLDAIESVVPLQEAAAQAIEEVEALAAQIEEEAPPPPPPPAWKGHMEFGATGSMGNTEESDIRLGAGAIYEDDDRLIDLSAIYLLSYTRGDRSKNQLYTRGRHDWKFGESPWFIFAQATAEVDEFKEWDYRLASGAGVGYKFIDDEDTYLAGRAGFGVSREFGGSNDRVKPEGLLGIDFRHRLSDRVSISAMGEYYPDFDEMGEYRAVGETSLDVRLSDDEALILRLGVRDEYDSTPGAAEANDLYYFATVVYSF